MRKNFYLLFLTVLFLQNAWAQDLPKLLYTTTFQNWTAESASATEKTATKKTDFSNEDLTFKFKNITVNPTGTDPKFNTADATVGYMRAEKVAATESYIELSPLNSITKIEFVHSATGSNRGFKLWKKSSTDADWVAISSNVANPAGGHKVTINLVDQSNVALKFTNLTTEFAFLLSLNIYGNYTSSNPQFPLTTSVNIDGAGAIARTPNSDQYDQGTSVSLQATANFGYKFIKWVDGTSEADLSTSNPYSVTMDAAKNIKAVFQTVNTYTLSIATAGSPWGQVQLSPLPTNGKYEEGTQVTMKIVSNPVAQFTYWEDNTTLAERVVTMDGNKSFTATFDEVPFIVGWNFKTQTPTQSRAGDFYSETTNTGLISAYDPSGSAAGWLANTGAFSPSYPNIRFWTSGSEFATKRRYLKAQFSTVNYKNIQVKSLVSANYQAYSVIKLQYSLDDLTYTDLASANITDVYNTGWKDLNAVLPADAQGKSRIYIRWLPDETSARLGNTTDNDGTAFTNIYIFADKDIVADTEAPVMVSTVPVNGSNTASVNGSVVITFNEKVKAATGNITLGSTVVTGAYGSKTATFKYEKLNYNTEYTFTIPSGALTDQSGNAFAGLSLTFKTGVRREPAKQLFDAVVAKDGTGNYTSVIDAIAAAPSNRTLPWLIYIKNGKYTGHHDIPSTKPFIHLIGQSRDGVIISDNRLSGGDNAYHVSLGATMVVNSADCYFENITLENSYGFENQAGPQALALYTLMDRFTTNNCYLRSYQDTYLTSYGKISDRHYLKNTKIEGAVDFIYGGGDVFFDKCTLTMTRKDGGYIVAPSHGNGTAWGYVFSNCTIDESKVTGATTYFGRAWQNAPKTVFLNTTLKTGIYAGGWYYKMGAIPAVFADYNTMDANGNAVDVSQRISNYEYDVKDANGNVTSTVKGTAKSSLTDAEAATYTYENVVLRSGDSWDPRIMAEAPDNPSNVTVSGSTISWNNVPYSRLYIVFRNDNVIGFTTSNQYTDATSVSGTSYTYAIQAASEYGALSSVTSASQVLPITGIELQAKKSNQSVLLTWNTKTEKNVSHFEIERSSDGVAFNAIGQTAVAGNSSSVKRYNFTDALPLQGDLYYRIKAVDTDGKYTYSSVVAVKVQGNAGLLVYPTIAATDIQVVHPRISGENSIRIIGLNGQQIRSFTADNNSIQTPLSISNLAPGVYIIAFQNGTTTLQTKFIKQ